MNAIDAFLLISLVFPALFGLWLGMLWQVGLLAGVVGGGVAAAVYGPALAFRLWPETDFAPFLGYLTVFAGVFFAVQVCRWALRSLLSWSGLRWLDHLAGAAVAGATGALSAAVLLTLFGLTLGEKKPEIFERSTLLPHARALVCDHALDCDTESTAWLEEAELSLDPATILRLYDGSQEGAASADQAEGDPVSGSTAGNP